VGFLASHFVLFSAGGAHAEPQIETSLKPSKAVKTGETLHFLVQLTWRSGEGEYRFPLPQLALENLTVEATGEANEAFQREGVEWRKKLFRFDLKPLRKGRAKIQPFRIDYLDPSQQRSGHFNIGTQELSVFPDYTNLYRFVFIAGGSLVGVGVLGGWILMRRIRRKYESPPKVESILEVQALSRLAANRGELLEAGKIFRAYVAEKFSLPGGTETGREILQKLEEKLPSDEMKTLKRIFGTLEEWQFSGFPYSREEGERLYSEMTHYVEGKKII